MTNIDTPGRHSTPFPHRRPQLPSVLICLLAAASCGKADAPADNVVEAAIQPVSRMLALESERNPDVQYSLWLGPADGEAWYAHDANTTLPAASAIKTAILIEFFSEQVSALDTVFGPLEDILDDPDGAAIAHFSPERQADARRELRSLTVRQLAEAMIHGDHVETNAAYNAAANVIIEYLGGPGAVSRRIRKRFPGIGEMRVARYMLADRSRNPDNLLTAKSLATVLQYVAGGTADDRPDDRPDDRLITAVREVLYLETEANRGMHYYKGGTLRSEPPVRIEAGWWERDGVGSVYVVIASRIERTRDREAFDRMRAALGELSTQMQDAGIAIRDTVPSSP